MESNGGPRVAFVVVTKGLDYPTAEERRPSGARYTRDAIRGMLQFMGCKPRHAYKAAQLVFQKLERFAAEGSKFSFGSRQLWGVGAHDEGSVYVTLPRSEFYELVCSTLTEYNYKYVPSSDEIKAACSLKERRRHVIVLLCGTSGSGKSTLASILASRLGISTVLSTDSVRHMMRSFTTAAETPLLFASTYEAGEALRKQQALDEAREQLVQKQGGEGGPGRPGAEPPEVPEGAAAAAPAAAPPGTSAGPTAAPPPNAHDQAIRGYKAQCELVSEQLEQLICGFEARRQSLVIEGVHLHVGLVMRLLQLHPGVVPFLVYIKSEGKHVERMAVRAKYMTLDPNKNKYVKNMRNIRWIQDYLFRKAEKHAIPCVENTNIDRSVGLIHLTLLGCLKRLLKGEQVLDTGSSTVRMLHNEYTAVVEALSGPAPPPPLSGPAPPPPPPAATAAAAAAAAPPAACGMPSQREGSGNLQLPSTAPLRMLGSPRVFNRESGTGAYPWTPSGDGGPGGEAPAAYGGPGGALAHSSPQLEALAVSYPNGTGLLLPSSPQHQQTLQQQQQQQSRINRRSSCSSPHDAPPLPSPPQSLLAGWPVLPVEVLPASPSQHPGPGGGGGGGGGGGAAGGRPASWSSQNSLALHSVLRDHEAGVTSHKPQAGLPMSGRAGGAGRGPPEPSGSEEEAGAAAVSGIPSCMSVAQPAAGQGEAPLITVRGVPAGCQQQQEGGRLVTGSSPSMSPSGLQQAAAQQQQEHHHHQEHQQQQQQQEMSPFSEDPERSWGRQPPQQQQIHELQGRAGGGALPSLVAAEPPQAQQQFARSSRKHAPQDDAGASDGGGELTLAPSSPVFGAPMTASADEVHPPHGDVRNSGGDASSGDASGGSGRTEPPLQRSPQAELAALGCNVEGFGALAAAAAAGPVPSVPIAAAAAVSSPAPRAPGLSPQQQQHLDAVLPACMRLLGGPGGGSPVGTAMVGGRGGSAAATPEHCSLSLPSLIGGGEGGVNLGHRTSRGGGGGDDEAGAGAACGQAAGDRSNARAKSVAYAAAKDAYSRFGDQCPDEVLRAVVQSAILDEQMDGVTESSAATAVQQPQQQQQHPRGERAGGDVGHGTGAAGGRRSTPHSGSASPYTAGSPAPAPPALPAGSNGSAAAAPQLGPASEASPAAATHGGAAPGGDVRQLLALAGAMDMPDDGALAAAAEPLPVVHVDGSQPQPGGGVAAAGAGGASAFAGAHAWAASAALGAPAFLRTDSRRLGESSSPSPSGYSSDDFNGADGGGVDAPGGGAAVRRQRDNLRGDADSDDADGDGYTGYGYYGAASPLQEYGSVYESATHDDMDEHGDDDEALPLGRSNTIIKHLAGALERSRMRASASAAATGGRPPAAAGTRPHGPPPAASSGAALRLSVSRRTPGAAAAGPSGGAGGSAEGGGGRGGEAGTGSAGSAAGPPDIQLRQLLRGGAGARGRAAAADPTLSGGQLVGGFLASCSVSAGVEVIPENGGPSCSAGVAGSVLRNPTRGDPGSEVGLQVSNAGEVEVSGAGTLAVQLRTPYANVNADQKTDAAVVAAEDATCS